MLVGRADECAALAALLDAAREGRGSARVLRGEAGVGKSALLAEAGAIADDVTVLRARGVESEAELAFAGLHQLLRPLLGGVEALPAPQAAALRSAFALSDEPGGERFPVSLAALSLLSEAAAERPVLCLVDDLPWLDQPSAEAVLFCARRVEAEAVVVLVTVRDDPDGPVAIDGVDDLRLGPLGADDARALLRADLAPEARDWVLATAAGNPLALVELPAALPPPGGAAALDPALTAPTTVEATYRARVDALPADVRALLLVAACEDVGDRATVVAAADRLGAGPEALAGAEVSGLLRLGRDRLDLAHPLARSALLRGAGPVDREAAHRALADVLVGPEHADRRAWHRAATVAGTDDAVAAELEATAERAGRRGGHATASAALERAAELSAGVDDRSRRRTAAARAAWHAGQPQRTLLLADRALVDAPDERERAELAYLRGMVELRCGSVRLAGDLLLDAAGAVEPFHPDQAHQLLLDAGSAAAKAGDGRRLGEIAARLPTDRDLRARLLAGMAGLVDDPGGADTAALEVAIGEAADTTHPRALTWAAMAAACLGHPAEPVLLRRAIDAARATRAVDTLVFVLETVVNAAMMAGRYDRIEVDASEGLRLAREYGLVNAVTEHQAALALVAGIQGRDDDCRRLAADVDAATRRSHLADARTAAAWGVALLDLGQGRLADAVARLTALGDASPGVTHRLVLLPAQADLVDGFLRTGEVERAEATAARLATAAPAGAPSWLSALAARCRGQVATGEEAEVAFQEALRLHGDGDRAWDRARTELAYGEHLRRERRRADARDHLRDALATFEWLGAAPWVERARHELRATGETVRPRDVSPLEALTPQELQIAGLVARGLSNKDVAAQVFLSPRTVEYHLGKVFTKLGLSSRAELVRDGIPDQFELDPQG
jgi:DNA-binding CsgD family transcriptional regulator